MHFLIRSTIGRVLALLSRSRANGQNTKVLESPIEWLEELLRVRTVLQQDHLIEYDLLLHLLKDGDELICVDMLVVNRLKKGVRTASDDVDKEG